jgi:hypothetical protein
MRQRVPRRPPRRRDDPCHLRVPGCRGAFDDGREVILWNSGIAVAGDTRADAGRGLRRDRPGDRRSLSSTTVPLPDRPGRTGRHLRSRRTTCPAVEPHTASCVRLFGARRTSNAGTAGDSNPPTTRRSTGPAVGDEVRKSFVSRRRGTSFWASPIPPDGYAGSGS